MKNNIHRYQKVLEFGRKHGIEIMKDALIKLDKNLGDEYKPEKGIVPFAVGEYLMVREDMINYGCVAINDMQDFDKMAREIIGK